MVKGKVKQLSLIIFLPIFLMFLSACDPEVEMPDYVTFLSHDGRVINTAPINHNRVDFFIPEIAYNLDNRDFTGWYYVQDGEDVPFDFGSVGDTRTVHARFNQASVQMPVSVIIRDEINLAEAPGWSRPDMKDFIIEIDNSQTVNGITIREILNIAAREAEYVEIENRTLVWYYLEFDEDETPNIIFDQEIDVYSRRFRFVELQELVEVGGVSVAGVNEIIWRNITLDLRENDMTPSIPEATLNAFPRVNWDNLEPGLYRFEIPQGDTINDLIMLDSVLNAVNNPGMEVNTIRWEEFSPVDSIINERTPDTSHTWFRNEFISEMAGRPMPGAEVYISIGWRGETLNVTIGALNSPDNNLNFETDGEEFTIYQGEFLGQSLWNQEFDLFEFIDPLDRRILSHWVVNIDTGSGLEAIGTIRHIGPSDDPANLDFRVVGHSAVVLTGVWVDQTHYVEMWCQEDNLHLYTIPVIWGHNVTPLVTPIIPEREGYEFVHWLLDGTQIPTVHPMPPLTIVLHARWQLRMSNLYLRSTDETERINGSAFDDHFIGEFGYFESPLAAIIDFLDRHDLTRHGHTIGNLNEDWFLDAPGAPGGRVRLTYDIQMNDQVRIVFVEWTANVHTVTIENGNVDFDVVITNNTFQVSFGQEVLVSQGLMQVRASHVDGTIASIITWRFRDTDFDFTDTAGLPMPNNDIELLIFTTEPPAEAEDLRSDIIFVVGDEVVHEAAVVTGDYIRYAVDNANNIVNLMQQNRRVVVRWRVYNEDTTVFLFEIDINDNDWRDRVMTSHDLRMEAILEWRLFQLTFHENLMNHPEIELIGYNGGIYLHYGQSILEQLTGITATRIGFDFIGFVFAGDIVDGTLSMGTADIVLNATQSIAWREYFIQISVTLTGDIAGATRPIAQLEFREGRPLNELISMFNNNLTDGREFIVFSRTTHDLSFEHTNILTNADGVVIRNAVGSPNVTFTLHHARSRVVLSSEVDPRFPNANTEWDDYFYVSHTERCILTYLSGIALGVIPGPPLPPIFLNNLGVHPTAGRFDHWIITDENDNRLFGGILQDNQYMPNQNINLTAYWARSGEITIKSGAAMFLNEAGQPASEMTLTGINPGVPIRPILTAFVEAVNGLNGEPVIQHPEFNIPVRAFTGLGQSFYIRVMSGRQIYGFSLIGDNFGVNVLHSQNEPQWDEGTEGERFSVNALVKNYTTTGLQHRAVTLEDNDFMPITGREITQIGSQPNVIFPTFINGQRVISIASTGFSGNNALAGIQHITLPKYLMRSSPLRSGGPDTQNVGTLNLNLENMPWFSDIPANFIRMSAGNTNNNFTLDINPITPIRSVGANAFVTGEWNAAEGFRYLNMRGFQHTNGSDVTWWNVRNQFTNGFASTFNRVVRWL